MHVLTFATALLPYISTTQAAPKPPTPYSEWMATSFLSKTPPVDRKYVSAVLHEGILKAATLHSNSTLQSSVTHALSSLVSENGTLIGWKPSYYSLDDIRVGNNFLQLYLNSGKKEQKYKTAATALRKQLDRWPRTPTGGFWHRDPTYPNQMWLDGIYMAQPFYATYTAMFDRGNRTAWEEIALQFELIEEHTRNRTSGLLQHGYDESKKAIWADPVTGASPLVWDRSVGWYFMALVEVLQVYPKDIMEKEYERLAGYLEVLAKALKVSQDKSGGWWLVMNEPYPGMKGNYIESSGTAMFTYGFLKGVRTGLLQPSYRNTAAKAFDLMVERFVKVETNGTLSWEGTVEVGSLNSNASFEYYTSVPLSINDGKGAGPFMFAATEMEMWKRSK